MNSSGYYVLGGVAVGVLALAGIVAYGTANQLNYVQEDSVLAEAASQGVLPKTGMLGADLNKEQWHEDPFGDKAASSSSNFWGSSP